MFPILLINALFAPAKPLETHDTVNPLYKQLLDPGLAIGTNLNAKLPPPTMPDGLDAAQQTAAIRALIGSDYSYEEFTRRSVVAPQLLKIRDIIPSDPMASARGVDIWFVAYGDFKSMDDDKFLDRLLGAGRKKGGSANKADGLEREALAKRNITIPEGLQKRERYGFVGFDFLDRVRLRATGRVIWSRTADSVLAAAEIDPRFLGDKEFPNEWQPLTRDGEKVNAGPALPWSGAAFYLKATKLAEPAQAIFVEQHIVFVEPSGWFQGTNLLRSKLPPAVQIIVRDMRREWVKADKISPGP